MLRLGRCDQERKKAGAQWDDFAVLYRSHFHRDELAAELVEQDVPFSIENMDVLDTPQVRDLLACLGAVVSSNDGASLFRVSALPQFAIDPSHLRAAMKSLPKDTPASGFATVLGSSTVAGSSWRPCSRFGRKFPKRSARAKRALEIIADRFVLPPSGPLEALLKFAEDWEAKPVTETGELGDSSSTWNISAKPGDRFACLARGKCCPPDDSAYREGVGVETCLHPAGQFEFVPLLLPGSADGVPTRVARSGIGDRGR